MLSETIFACSTDETRLALNGCLVELTDGTLNVVGCDGFRLALTTATNIPVTGRHRHIIPARTVHELLRLLGDDPEKPHRLTVTAGPGLIQFSFGEITLLSKLIEGDYPAYQRILPVENVTAIVPRSELIRSLNRIALVADNAVLSFGKCALHLKSEGKRGLEFLGDASDSLLNPSNHEAQATFSARYLLDILNAIPDESLEIHIGPTGRPALFKPPGRDWRSVLLPVVPEKEKEKAPKKPKATPASAGQSEPQTPESK